MNVKRMVTIILMVGLLIIPHVVQASTHSFTPINEPQAGTGQSGGASAVGINQQGDIVGYYDHGNSTDGFLLHQGQYTTLDAPNAAPSSGSGLRLTLAVGINGQGDIVGLYFDSNAVAHGFLLHQGQYTLINDPKAGTKKDQGTEAFGINDQGDVVGIYIGPKGALHGFLWQ